MHDPHDILVVQLFHDLQLTTLDFLILHDLLNCDNELIRLYGCHIDLCKSTLCNFNLINEVPTLQKIKQSCELTMWTFGTYLL
jgi:hypothetical protein